MNEQINPTYITTTLDVEGALRQSHAQIMSAVKNKVKQRLEADKFNSMYKESKVKSRFRKRDINCYEMTKEGLAFLLFVLDNPSTQIHLCKVLCKDDLMNAIRANGYSQIEVAVR